MQELAAEVLSSDSLLGGHTVAEWSVRWWRWLLSMPRMESPAFDLTGRNCSLYQVYPEVYFLCQTIGNSESQVIRNVTIPKNKALFMPIINWISISGVDGETVEELDSVAKKKIDAVTDLELKLDGRHVGGLNKYRSRSRVFDIILPKNNVLDATSGSRRCVSDGYWIFLKPTKKIFTLSSFGSCSSGVNRIGVNYELSVS